MYDAITRPRAEYKRSDGTRREIGEVDGAWRNDTFVDERGKRTLEPIMHAGTSDVSDYHMIYGGYDSRCGCCWLNIPHTEDKHAASIGSK